jgi:aspartate 1-decarboxylase
VTGWSEETIVQRTLLSSKIHRRTVTGADPDYAGSITLDRDLMDAAGIVDYERVQVVDVTNGARLETYAIPGLAGSGTIQLNGAAALIVDPGDVVIVMAYVQLDESEVSGWQPQVVHVDEHNRVTGIRAGGEALEPAVARL